MLVVWLPCRNQKAVKNVIFLCWQFIIFHFFPSFKYENAIRFKDGILRCSTSTACHTWCEMFGKWYVSPFTERYQIVYRPDIFTLCVYLHISTTYISRDPIPPIIIWQGCAGLPALRHSPPKPYKWSWKNGGPTTHRNTHGLAAEMSTSHGISVMGAWKISYTIHGRAWERNIVMWFMFGRN